MECMKCGYENEPDAKFCRQCGSQIAIPTTKDQVEFVPIKRRATDQDLLCFGEEHETAPEIVAGVVFIFVSLIIAVAIFWPGLFSDFGTTIGNLAGGFGETMGNLGSDIGEFFGNWGDTFGNAIGNFFDNIFTDIMWWDILKILIVGTFFIIGVTLIIVNLRKR